MLCKQAVTSGTVRLEVGGTVAINLLFYASCCALATPAYILATHIQDGSRFEAAEIYMCSLH